MLDQAMEDIIWHMWATWLVWKSIVAGLLAAATALAKCLFNAGWIGHDRD